MSTQWRDLALAALTASFITYAATHEGNSAIASGRAAQPKEDACEVWETKRVDIGVIKEGWEPFAAVVRGNSVVVRRCQQTAQQAKRKADLEARRLDNYAKRLDAANRANRDRAKAVEAAKQKAMAEAAAKARLRNAKVLPLGTLDAVNAAVPVMQSWIGKTVRFDSASRPPVQGKLRGIRGTKATVDMGGKRMTIDLMAAMRASLQ